MPWGAGVVFAEAGAEHLEKGDVQTSPGATPAPSQLPQEQPSARENRCQKPKGS